MTKYVSDALNSRILNIRLKTHRRYMGYITIFQTGLAQTVETAGDKDQQSSDEFAQKPFIPPFFVLKKAEKAAIR